MLDELLLDPISDQIAQTIHRQTMRIRRLIVAGWRARDFVPDLVSDLGRNRRPSDTVFDDFPLRNVFHLPPSGCRRALGAQRDRFPRAT
jgi:hypothetical protein